MRTNRQREECGRREDAGRHDGSVAVGTGCHGPPEGGRHRGGRPEVHGVAGVGGVPTGSRSTCE